jgi:hypothetical protein
MLQKLILVEITILRTMDEPQLLSRSDCSNNVGLPVDHETPSQIQRRDQSSIDVPCRCTLSLWSGLLRIRPVSDALSALSALSLIRLGPLPSLMIQIPMARRKGGFEQCEALFNTPLALL